MREKLAQSPAFVKALIWLGWMGLFGILFTVGYTAYVMMTGNQSAHELRMMQLVQVIAIFVLPPIVAAGMWTKKPFSWLGMNHSPNWKLLLTAFVMMLLAQPGINLITNLNEQIQLPAAWDALEANMRMLEQASEEVYKLLLDVHTVGGILGCFIIMAVIPGIGEEMCFRGMFQNLLTGARDPRDTISFRQHAAVWAVAIIFSAAHLQFSGFFPRMLLGAILGYLYLWSNNLWVPIIAHFTNNAFVVALDQIEKNTALTEEQLETFATGGQWWIGVISIVLVLGALTCIRMMARKQAVGARVSDVAA